VFTKEQAFVAMPFNDSELDEIYEDVVRKAIEDAGLKCFRADEVYSNQVITEDIIREIYNSIVVVADLTELNPNVLYEVGFAHAIGKEVIIIARQGTNVPFDVRARRYIMYGITARKTQALKDTLTMTLNNVVPYAEEEERKSRIGQVVSHGTKFTVPHSHEFWNNLLKAANHRFYLVGYSNKSWINRTEEQSLELSQAIIHIIEQNGTVKILSVDEEKVKTHHERFLRDYIYRSVKALPPDRRQKVLARIKDNIKPGLIYAVSNKSHYGAVVSDDRLLLLPTMNTQEFRSEALVLELKRGINSPQFENYLGDIDRLFNDGAKKIELTFS
jgi:nucleoside 2-deoxyribosyltransferase